jgi:peptidoglycan/LPS O-acetylase OafA/YrhL
MAFYYSNFQQLAHTPDLFNSWSSLWSLAIEEQFYLLWPMLLLLLWRRPRLMRSSVALLTVGSFVLCLMVGARSSVANFYFPLSRFWELGLGCLLAVLLKESSGSVPPTRYRRLTTLADSLLPIVGAVLICVSLLLFDRKTAFPGWAALVPTVGALCVIAGRGGSWFQRRVMGSNVLVFIGLSAIRFIYGIGLRCPSRQSCTRARRPPRSGESRWR